MMKQSSELSDKEIIQLLKDTGDTQYFGLLYDKYAPKVYQKCISMVKNEDNARDLVHDILVKAFVKIGTFRGDASFSTWIYHIAYNACIDFLKKEQKNNTQIIRDVVLSDTENIEDEVEDVEIKEMRLERLEEVFILLDPDEKTLLLMKYQDELKINEIVEILNISEGAVKMRLKRARAKLKKMYEQKSILQ
ncbi:MAG: RNA polymerase sigma factor [Chitinophagales bacterium]